MNFLHKLNLNFFFIKREFYFHKIQYSKVFKHDVAAAIFGIVLGAFVVYLSLNTLGSGSPDLSDLSLILWYFIILYLILHLNIIIFRYKIGIMVWRFFLISFCLIKEIRLIKKILN